jgi:hypothetical protein
MGALLLGAALSSSGPRVEDYLADAAHLQWSCTDAPLQADEERRQLAAIAEYTSQVKAFGGMAAVCAFLRQVHIAVNGEPFWQARPGN